MFTLSLLLSLVLSLLQVRHYLLLLFIIVSEISPSFSGRYLRYVLYAYFIL